MCLKRFWDLESLGIVKQESSVYEKFIQKITFNGHNYEVSLPWKECHPPLPHHYELCYGRLLSLLRRLRQTPQLLAEYDSIIQDQLAKNIIEIVPEPPAITTDHTHYLPHHTVVRQDKSTSKLRIVYDASAKSTGPSLNECLYTGPKFGQSIFSHPTPASQTMLSEHFEQDGDRRNHSKRIKKPCSGANDTSFSRIRVFQGNGYSCKTELEAVTTNVPLNS